MMFYRTRINRLRAENDLFSALSFLSICHELYFVGFTGMILPRLSNFMRSIQTSRCVPGMPLPPFTKFLFIR